ncbi:four-carbon acid sugar kinase family protein (plasmid) [Paroceanicella profunda]|uniref:3-oxo-tetronate kinase n=1 Tax=Paroceanicella profunda TaxID=2579971 RepID=A0A5B8G1S1_9RHOB|nr:3-oxo-tetronate kinase [Paroceanicella profunda]QDL94615.1 four-carbon acid sugar kinase family protein [Paroceanicella profunda]
MLLGCIGDDFTGSSDLANTLAKQGMRVTQYSGVPTAPAEAGVEAGVVALKSRTIAPQEAIAQSLKALEWLQAQGCRQFLFKYCSTFDSTPEGNIGPVAAALAERLDAWKVIVCPVFPATGRTLFEGHLFVNGKLLSESGMQDHPLTPMTDPDIRRWLARQTEMPVGHVSMAAVRRGAEAISAAFEAEHSAGRRLLVTDAIADADLMEIGAAAAGLPLITGGSGIAMGLPENFRREGLLAGGGYDWQGSDGPCVVLSGSCSIATRGQVAYHKARHPALQITVDDVIAGTTTAEGVADWLLAQEGLPLAYATAEPAVVRAAQETYGRARAASAIEDLFAEVTRLVVARGATRIIAAGGETSGAVVEALDLDALAIGPEIAPGAPALAAGPLRLTLKSGNFGDETFFETAAKILGGA